MQFGTLLPPILASFALPGALPAQDRSPARMALDGRPAKVERRLTAIEERHDRDEQDDQ